MHNVDIQCSLFSDEKLCSICSDNMSTFSILKEFRKILFIAQCNNVTAVCGCAETQRRKYLHKIATTGLELFTQAK
jgi:hypothetical protein